MFGRRVIKDLLGGTLLFLKLVLGLVLFLFLLFLLYIYAYSGTNITGNYQFSDWGGMQTITYDPWDLYPEGNAVIGPQVIKYDYNSKYIATLVHPEEPVGDTEQLAYTEYCEYYVVDVKHHKVVGPMTRNEYKSMQVKTEIPIENIDQCPTSRPAVRK